MTESKSFHNRRATISQHIINVWDESNDDQRDISFDRQDWDVEIVLTKKVKPIPVGTLIKVEPLR